MHHNTGHHTLLTVNGVLPLHSTRSQLTGKQAASHHCNRYTSKGAPRVDIRPLSAATAPTTGWLRKFEMIAHTQRVHRFAHLSAGKCIVQRSWPLAPLACLVQSRGWVPPYQRTSPYDHHLPIHRVSFCQRETTAGVWCPMVGKPPPWCNRVEPPLAVGTM